MRIGAVGRWPSFVVLAMIVAIAIASLKPWSTGAPQAPAATRAPDAALRGIPLSATPDPTPTPAATPGPTSILCYTSRAWRIVALERAEHIERRSWLAARPVFQASGPGDPRIEYVRLFTPGAVGLGVCVADASVGGPAALSQLSITVWRRGSGGRYVRETDPDLLSSGADGTSVLLSAGDSTGGELRPWPNGRYVLRVSGSGGWAGWFGVDVVPSRQPDERS